MPDFRKVIIPDLVSHCPFPLRTNRHCASVSSGTQQWLFRYGGLSPYAKLAMHGLRAGRLTTMCYPTAGAPQLRACCDFLTFLFHLDNLSDDMDDRSTRKIADAVLNALYHPRKVGEGRLGRMTTHYWRRIGITASPGTLARFTETMDFFFQAVSQQARDRALGIIPDLESYIQLRRDTSGCKPCWALIEYANNLNIPDEVMDHPVLRSLGQAVNDLVTWSNDIFSFKVEQARGDTHNMIPVIMYNRPGLSTQDAIDIVGEMCKRSIDRFKSDRQVLPKWGPAIDRQVEIYVDGLADWIVGSLHWSFESERYFGKEGMTIKKTRIVEYIHIHHRPHRDKASTLELHPQAPPSPSPPAPRPSENTIGDSDHDLAHGKSAVIPNDPQYPSSSLRAFSPPRRLVERFTTTIVSSITRPILPLSSLAASWTAHLFTGLRRLFFFF